ncbi:hypothetical protein O9929_21360 [Vibrio lentus]|nr:hypothetical protein [Vibrio lentus]
MRDVVRSIGCLAAFAGRSGNKKAWMMTILGLITSTVGIDKGVGVEDVSRLAYEPNGWL